MNFKKTFSALVIGAAMTASFASCNSDTDNTPPAVLYTQIVTVESATSSSAVFSYTNEKTNLPVTLYASGTFSTEEIYPGRRVAITYTAENNVDNGGTISLYGITRAFGDGKALEVTTAGETTQFYNGAVANGVASFSGTYLNGGVSVSVGNNPDPCALVVDESTVGDDYPTVRMVLQQSYSDTSRWIFFSYSISDLFQRPDMVGAKGLRVVYSTSETSEIKIERPANL